MLSNCSRATPCNKKDLICKITDDERQRMAALETERGIAFNRFYRSGRMNEPSLVLEDFLYLGNMQHASNRDLLVRFDISLHLN
jgi:hypothetical protein